ncbi:MAG: DinB family protein [Anaerolineae bacterium]|nr:DinB family protein [Gemmatimonadaceae bacterium]
MPRFALAIALLLAAPATAQIPAQAASSTQMPPRAIMLEDVERSRQNVLKYVDAAPDSMLGYRPGPGVRTFAEQIEHAAGANIFILSAAFKQKPPASYGDSAKYRHDKTALKAFVNKSYDHFATAVRDFGDAQLQSDAAFAGSTKIGWRWISTALEHATWTLGQTVPYLRANKVTPPQYLPF